MWYPRGKFTGLALFIAFGLFATGYIWGGIGVGILALGIHIIFGGSWQGFVTTTIILLAMIGLINVLDSCGSGDQTSNVKVSQIAGQSTATKIVASNKPKVSTPTERPTNAPSCLNWKSVTGIHDRKQVCVYGRIAKIGGTTKYPVIIRFSEEPGAFMIRGPYRGFDATKGQCIKAEGVVLKDITFLYMDTEEIKLSDYDGCK